MSLEEQHVSTVTEVYTKHKEAGERTFEEEQLLGGSAVHSGSRLRRSTLPQRADLLTELHVHVAVGVVAAVQEAVSNDVGEAIHNCKARTRSSHRAAQSVCHASLQSKMP